MSEKGQTVPTTAQDTIRWQKSSFSPSDNCVEVAEYPDDTIAVRDSNHPDAGALHFTRADMAAWVQGCKAGEFDHLT